MTEFYINDYKVKLTQDEMQLLTSRSNHYQRLYAKSKNIRPQKFTPRYTDLIPEDIINKYIKYYIKLMKIRKLKSNKYHEKFKDMSYIFYEVIDSFRRQLGTPELWFDLNMLKYKQNLGDDDWGCERIRRPLGYEHVKHAEFYSKRRSDIMQSIMDPYRLNPYKPFIEIAYTNLNMPVPIMSEYIPRNIILKSKCKCQFCKYDEKYNHSLDFKPFFPKNWRERSFSIGQMLDDYIFNTICIDNIFKGFDQRFDEIMNILDVFIDTSIIISLCGEVVLYCLFEIKYSTIEINIPEVVKNGIFKGNHSEIIYGENYMELISDQKSVKLLYQSFDQDFQAYIIIPDHVKYYLEFNSYKNYTYISTCRKYYRKYRRKRRRK